MGASKSKKSRFEEKGKQSQSAIKPEAWLNNIKVMKEEKQAHLRELTDNYESERNIYCKRLGNLAWLTDKVSDNKDYIKTCKGGNMPKYYDEPPVIYYAKRNGDIKRKQGRESRVEFNLADERTKECYSYVEQNYSKNQGSGGKKQLKDREVREKLYQCIKGLKRTHPTYT